MEMIQDHVSTESVAPRLSASDLRLKKYLELKSLIKKLNKEKSVIEEEIKHKGSHYTRHYIVTVESKPVELGPNKDTLLETYGDAVRSLFKLTKRTTIAVNERGES